MSKNRFNCNRHNLFSAFATKGSFELIGLSLTALSGNIVCDMFLLGAFMKNTILSTDKRPFVYFMMLVS